VKPSSNILYFERLSNSTSKRTKLLDISFDGRLYLIVFDKDWLARAWKNRKSISLNISREIVLFNLGMNVGDYSLIKRLFYKAYLIFAISGLIKHLKNNNINTIYIDYENQLIDRIIINNIKHFIDVSIVGLQRFFIHRGNYLHLASKSMYDELYKPDRVLIEGSGYSDCMNKQIGADYFGYLKTGKKDQAIRKITSPEGYTHCYVILGPLLHNVDLIKSLLRQMSSIDEISILVHPLNDKKAVSKEFAGFNYAIKLDRSNYMDNSIVIASPTSMLSDFAGIARDLYLIVLGEDECYKKNIDISNIIYIKR
jgi:hypothetical protein